MMFIYPSLMLLRLRIPSHPTLRMPLDGDYRKIFGRPFFTNLPQVWPLVTKALYHSSHASPNCLFALNDQAPRLADFGQSNQLSSSC